MKKFLAIYGLGFMAGIVTIEFAQLWVKFIKLSKKANADSNELKAYLQNMLDRHPDWDWTEDHKKQLRNMGFDIR